MPTEIGNQALVNVRKELIDTLSLEEAKSALFGSHIILLELASDGKFDDLTIPAGEFYPVMRDDITNAGELWDKFQDLMADNLLELDPSLETTTKPPPIVNTKRIAHARRKAREYLASLSHADLVRATNGLLQIIGSYANATGDCPCCACRIPDNDSIAQDGHYAVKLHREYGEQLKTNGSEYPNHN